MTIFTSYGNHEYFVEHHTIDFNLLPNFVNLDPVRNSYVESGQLP